MTDTNADRPAPSRTEPIVRADPGDAQRLTEVITAAFFAIAPCVWLFPDPGERRSLLPKLLRLHLDDALEHGAVYTTEDRCAAAVWFPRSDAYTPRHDEQARLIDALGAVHAARVHRYDAITETTHPAAPHDYLWAAAVHPDHQRTGIGSALLRAHHLALDERGRAAYLEASDTGTRQVYLRLGYGDLPVPRIVLPPPGGAVLYGMWRPPAAAGGDEPGWTPSPGEAVRVRAEVQDWGGSTGTVVGFDLFDSDRPVSVAIAEASGTEPEGRRFAVAELEPIPADGARATAPPAQPDAR